MNVFIVQGEYGLFEDHYNWIDSVHASREEAVARIEEIGGVFSPLDLNSRPESGDAHYWVHTRVGEYEENHGYWITEAELGKPLED